MNLKKVMVFLSTALFLSYTVWWLIIFFTASPDSVQRDYFTDSYGLIAGLGGLIGLYAAKKWEGFKSYVGKSLVFFALGLFSQFLGQLSYTIEFYIYQIENSYPSYGEVFYLLSIPCYIFGVIYIAKASGSAISLRDFKNKIGAIIFPLIMIAVSYYLFIKDGIDPETPLLENILNYAYPIGQATFVSCAIVAYFLSGKIMGGLMKSKVVLILFSLVLQYSADTVFLYKTINDTWYPADSSEYLFVLSYFVMTLAFIGFLTAFERLRKSD